MKEINICQALSDCDICPFEDECDITFKVYGTKEYWLEQMYEMRNDLDKAISKVENFGGRK